MSFSETVITLRRRNQMLVLRDVLIEGEYVSKAQWVKILKKHKFPTEDLDFYRHGWIGRHDNGQQRVLTEDGRRTMMNYRRRLCFNCGVSFRGVVPAGVRAEGKYTLVGDVRFPDDYGYRCTRCDFVN